MKFSRKTVTVICAVFLLFAVSAGITATAKYIKSQQVTDIAVKAKAFYFESNYLTENTKEYTLSSNTNSLTIELYNYENQLRISEVDCTYTVEVKCDNGNNCSSYTDLASKKATANMQVKTELELEQLIPGNTYTVTVTADGGYTKTLSAKFIISKEQNNCYYNAEDYGEYILLTVWTEDVTGALSVTFPDGLIPDNTDPVLKGVTNYEDNKYVAKTFTDNANFNSEYSSRSYRFFKADNYQNDNFNVKIDDNIPRKRKILNEAHHKQNTQYYHRRLHSGGDLSCCRRFVCFGQWTHIYLF